MGQSSIESAIRDYFAGRPHGIVAVYLFGSQARGQDDERSDVDIAVLLERDPPPTFQGLHLDLEGDLERHLGRSVDLVVLNRAPPDLVYRVLRDGKLLVDRNPSRRIQFEVRSRNERFDLQPILERYRHKETR